MKKRFIVLASCILLIFLFTCNVVAANSFSDIVLAAGDTHGLSLGSSTGGSASGAGTFTEGSSVTVSATPESGFVFV